MILACDQYEQTVQVAWGENPGEVQVEEYEVQKEAARRVQELMERAERVVITQESSLAGELEGREMVVSRIPRLYAVYWSLQDRLNGEDCLVLSIGQNSCVGGLVKEGRLIRQEAGSPDLTLRGIWQGWVEGNPPLRRALEAYLRGKELSEVEREVFQGFLKALRGRKVQSPIPFSPPLNPIKLSQVVKPLQGFLTQLDPRQEVKTLILTDWAAYGSLPELLRKDYQVLCSGDNSLADAVRGMILLGRAETERVSKTKITAFISKVRGKLDAAHQHYPIIDIAHEVRQLLLLSRSDPKSFSDDGLTSYVELSDEWEALLQAADQLGEQRGVDLEEQARKLLEDTEAFEKKVARLSQNHKPMWFIPLLDKAARVPALSEKVDSFRNFLGIEDIPVQVGAEAKNLRDFEIVSTEGKGRRSVIYEVFERGYREKATGTVIKLPKVAIRLEEIPDVQPLSWFTTLLRKCQAFSVLCKATLMKLIKERKGRFFALLFSLCALTGTLLIGNFLMLQDSMSVNETIEKELKEIDEKITKLKVRIAYLRNSGAGSGEIRRLQDQLAREYVQKMILYASVDGGIYREREILEAKRYIEELNIRSRLVHGDRRTARILNEEGLKYVRNKQFAKAVQTFQKAYQADPADIEIINNLGHAHMRNGDLDAAKQFLLLALILSPGRSVAWFDLGQTYAKQGNTAASVACFANTYRFSSDQNNTYQFLQKLAKEDDNARVRNAAKQALQLKSMLGWGN